MENIGNDNFLLNINNKNSHYMNSKYEINNLKIYNWLKYKSLSEGKFLHLKKCF